MTKLEVVKVLRDKYQAGVAMCKEAFDKFGDDLEACGKWIKENWKFREFTVQKNGAIFVYSHPQDHPVYAGMVELRCGTDFVARNDTFKELGKELALHIVGTPVALYESEDIEKQPYIRDSKKTIGDLLKEASQKLGETIYIERHVKWSIGDEAPTND